MKCQNANNYAFYILAISSLFFSFLAHAHIEHTVIAYYDLNAGRNAHYQLILSPQHKDTALTLIPLEHNNQVPSVFEISTCLNRSTESSQQGELHFSDAKADNNDLRLSNFSSFIVEHNLHTWWIHLNPQQNLLFTQDVGGLLITAPSAFIFSTTSCQQN